MNKRWRVLLKGACKRPSSLPQCESRFKGNKRSASTIARLPTSRARAAGAREAPGCFLRGKDYGIFSCRRQRGGNRSRGTARIGTVGRNARGAGIFVRAVVGGLGFVPLD